MTKGIDISVWNGTIDWHKIKVNPEVQFIYIKSCEGINSPDKKLLEHVAGAKSTGKPYGFYHL